MRNKPKTVDEYIAGFPEDVAAMLHKLRQAIREEAPDAEEVISYQMPAFRLHSNLVYFAGYRNHIGFYPTSSGIAAFRKELAPFETSKGAVRLPLDKPIPFELVRGITRFRIKEDTRKQKDRANPKRRRAPNRQRKK